MSPKIESADIVYQERFASGCSQKNIFTKLGGARNCLRLVVTKDFLWVTSWFPFSIFTSLYDLEHVIPLDSILSVRRLCGVMRNSILLTYRDALCGEHSLKLFTWKPNDFIRSLGVESDDAT
jgi:hypothetical protein